MEKGYVNHLNNLEVEAGGLLGFFDSDGLYIIEDGIKEELIKCNKTITDFKNNKISASAKVGEFVLQFYVYIQDGEDNKKRAGLFVDENSKLGFAKKELQTYVDSVILPNSGGFFDEIKKRYHLYLPDESEGVDMNNTNLTKIINKKSVGAKRYKTMIPVLMDIDKAYVLKMLALLKSSGEYGQKMLAELRQQMDNKKLNKLDKNYWRDIKILFDNLLMQNQNVFSTMIKERMEEIQKEYLKAYLNTKEPVKEAPKKAEKKKEKKKAGGFEGVSPPSYKGDKGKGFGVEQQQSPSAKIKTKTQSSLKTKDIKKEPKKPIPEKTTQNKTQSGSEIFGSRISNAVAEKHKKKKELSMER